MTEGEIRDIVKSVLHESADIQRAQYDQFALQTMATLLTAFGLDDRDRIEIRADFDHLRRWRKSTETVKKAGWVAIAGILTSGLMGALWLGVKDLLWK